MKATKLSRPHSTKIDNILGKKFKVLDDGFIRVIDYMGIDDTIVQAARVSYGEGTKKVRQDRGLIRYLMRHNHTTPFEMCEIKLHLRVPMDTWRQWIRHRTANVNEYSTRYSVAIDSAQVTNPNEWRSQSGRNKQGSEGYFDNSIGKNLSEKEKKLQEHSREVYKERLELGVAREQARKDLPLSTYTEAYWKIDLHNLFHFLSLRMDSHAQYEIRSYAKIIGEEIVSKWCPIAWEAFENYKLNSQSFFSHDLELIKLLLDGEKNSAINYARNLGWLDTDDKKEIKNNRERKEFEMKAKSININLPW